MADRVNQSKLPVKQGNKKSKEIKKWDNNTKIKPPETIASKNPTTTVPHVLKALTPDSDLDAFFQKRKPNAQSEAPKNDELNESNQPLQSESVPFGHVKTNPTTGQIKRARDYPKPWLSRPTRVDFTEQNAANLNASQRFNEIQSDKKVLAQNQKTKPQFDADTKELALLYAKTRREERQVKKEKKLNYNEYEPPWRRAMAGNDPANNYNLKPPHIVGTKLKIEMKPIRANVRAAKYPNRSDYQYQTVDPERAYPKPWQMEYQPIPGDARATDPLEASTSRKLSSSFASQIAPEFDRYRIPGSITLPEHQKHLNVDAFTFEDAVKGIRKNLERQAIINYEFEFAESQPSVNNLQEKQIRSIRIPDQPELQKKTRMPLRTQFFPNKNPKPEQIPKLSRIPYPAPGKPLLTPIKEDTNTEYETDFEELTENDQSAVETKELGKISSKQFEQKKSAQALIVPNIIRSGEFLSKPDTSEESSTSSEDEVRGEERFSTTSHEHTNVDETTTDEEELPQIKVKSKEVVVVVPEESLKRQSEERNLEDLCSSNKRNPPAAVIPPKEMNTRLPIARGRKKLKITKVCPKKTTISRKIQEVSSQKPEELPNKASVNSISDANDTNLKEEKKKADILFNSMSYTIVPNENGNGMLKLYENGVVVAFQQSVNNPEQPAIFCKSDFKNQNVPEFGTKLQSVDEKIPHLQPEVYHVPRIKLTDFWANSANSRVPTSPGYTSLMQSGSKSKSGNNNAVPDFPSYVREEEKQINKKPETPEIVEIEPYKSAGEAKNAVQPPENAEKVCYKANIVWDDKPFKRPSFMDAEIPLGKEMGNALFNILPPPTPYRDGFEEDKQILFGFPNKIETYKLEMQNQSNLTNKKSGEEHLPCNYNHPQIPCHQQSAYSNSQSQTQTQPIGLNIINMNYVSSSSSQSLGKSNRNNHRYYNSKSAQDPNFALQNERSGSQELHNRQQMLAFGPDRPNLGYQPPNLEFENARTNPEFRNERRNREFQNARPDLEFRGQNLQFQNQQPNLYFEHGQQNSGFQGETLEFQRQGPAKPFENGRLSVDIQDGRLNLSGQDSHLYQQHRQSNRVNPNLSSCPYSSNKHYEQYNCFHQMFEDEYPVFNTQLPEGRFLPQIVCPAQQANLNFKCNNQNQNYQSCPYPCSYFTNTQTTRPKYFAPPCEHMSTNQSTTDPNVDCYQNSCWNSDCPHCCNYKHNYDQEYDKKSCWKQGNRPIPVQSSVAFTMTESSGIIQQPEKIVHLKTKTQTKKVVAEPKTQIMLRVKKFDERSAKKVAVKDCNNNLHFERSHKGSKHSTCTDSSGEDTESESDILGYRSSEFETGDEIEECKKVEFPGPIKAKTPKKRVQLIADSGHSKPPQEKVNMKDYLLKVFLQKPSTAKRTLDDEPPRHASPPPPTAASVDSSNASIRVLMSRGASSFLPLANCDCKMCRRYINFNLGPHRSQSLSCLDQINYVQKNIQDMKKFRKQVPEFPTKVVDHPKGDRVDPMIQYAGRKGYGQVPTYIKKRKEEILAEKQIQLEVELHETILKINAIENRRKKSRRYWIKKVAAQTRKQVLERDLSSSEGLRQQNPRKRDHDDIFIGSYHPSSAESSDEVPKKPSRKVSPSQTDFFSISEKLPTQRQRLRVGITSAPGRIAPFTPLSSISETSLQHFKFLSNSQSLPDNVEHL